MTAVLDRPVIAGAPERRPHQVRGLANLHAAFAKADRAQIHWACGTGKTLLGRWLAEDLADGDTLVLLPSLALVAQTLAEWQAAGDWQFTALVVCSDKTTADEWHVDDAWWLEHGVRVTTQPGRVAQFLKWDGGLPRVVFSTYHSTPVVAAGAELAGATFGLAVCDEAHRLAGDPDRRFRTILDDRVLKVRRRLFATATPVYTSQDRDDQLSMADVVQFGPVADKLDFADAIEAGLLVDYEVLVIDATGDADKLAVESAPPAALAAASAEGLSRVVTFHSRVATAREFAKATNGLRLPDGRRIHAEAVAGSEPMSKRREALATLAAGHADRLMVLSNSRCLGEGVDVPAVDGVLFADPKSSQTTIIQAVGRALRPAPGKTRGLIIMPVVAPTDDPEEALAIGPFATVWAVLRSLRTIDPRIATDLAALSFSGTVPTGVTNPNPAAPPSRIRINLDGINIQTLVARLVDTRAGAGEWETRLEELRAFALRTGTTAVPAVTRLGRWVAAQRRAYADGVLSAEHAALLETVTGWSWKYSNGWWNADYAAVRSIAGRGLNLNHPDVHAAQLEHRPFGSSMTVGRWCAQQRHAYREAELSIERVGLCEQIPGWTWTAGLNPVEVRMIDALAEWVRHHGDANVPPGTVVGKNRLGDFVTAMRRRRAMDCLALPLAAEIDLVTPDKSQPGALEWRATETRWDINYQALMQFAARTGGCDIPYQATERLGGFVCNLHAWAVRNRHSHRHGRLDADLAARLEQVPGWTWERARAGRVKVGIGAREHGTRLGYAAGCTCDECTEANSTYEANRPRLKAAGLPTTSLVDASAARGHLRILEGQVGFRARTTMAKITGFNKKSIDLVINGDRARIYPDVDQVLRGLTAQQLFDYIEANPSPKDPFPAEPTLALIDDMLRRGWPKAWISRELGIGKTLQIAASGSGVVHRRTAEAITALHAALESVELPQRQCRTALPTLAELLEEANR